MARVIALDAAPDLRRLYASAALRRRRISATSDASAASLPDLSVERRDVRVDVTAMAAYARVCQLALTDTLPSTYPHLLAFPLQMLVMCARDFPLPLLGAVHVENHIESRRPVSVRERLHVAVWAQDLRAHRRGTQVDLVSQVSSSGELVWRGVSTYLSRGGDHPDAPGSQAPTVHSLAGLAAGPRWRLSKDAGRRYAAVSGDWNPIHLHALTARALGFPTAVAHGMYTYARVMGALAPRLPPESLTSRVWFRRPVYLPSSVVLRTAFADRGAVSVLTAATGAVEHVVVENAW
ncbi:MAG: MaoC/PaaZ C-terminal domain-containing protein [Humibacillus sp.]